MCAYVLATTAVSGREKETRRDITIDTCAYLLPLLVYVYVLATATVSGIEKEACMVGGEFALTHLMCMSCTV